MKTFKRVVKGIGLTLLSIAILFSIIFVILPKGPRDPLPYEDYNNVEKPLATAERYAAVTGTPWATDAAMQILEQGGNAYDASVAALLVLNVTNGMHAGFPSVAPTMIYDASSGKVRSYIGAGKAPQAATIEFFKGRGFKTMPSSDILSQLLPASPDVIVSLLEDYGTLSFSDVAAPAIRIAREGFPATEPLLKDLMGFSILYRIGFSVVMSYNAQVWMQNEWWRPFYPHDRLRFPDLANTFQLLSDVEQAVLKSGGSRREALQAIREEFYKGSIASSILALHKEKGGIFTQADLADYVGGWEQPITGSYTAYTLYTNGGWTQGMVGPLALQILEGIDLKSLGHNSPQYIHTVTQAIELAMADRDAYVGDPAFVDIPLDILMSKAYAVQQRRRMTGHAFGPLPLPGQIPGFSTISILTRESDVSPAANPFPELTFKVGNDTTQLAVIDPWGNAVVMTPSDFPWTPMVPGKGLTLGNRMNQFRLDPESPDALAPGKRPRITPHAMIVFKGGRFFMAYSTPGGDMQPQALVQVFLNMVVFGMDLQQAISVPRFYSISAPSSFSPHEANPGTLRLEKDLYEASAGGLQKLGYRCIEDTKWNMDFGGVGAIILGDDGKITAGADPRWETKADGK